MGIEKYLRMLADIFDVAADSIEDVKRVVAEHHLISAYQSIYGLRVDGDLGPVTKRRMDAPRFCGLPEQLNRGNAICRFNGSLWNGQDFGGEEPRRLKLRWHFFDVESDTQLLVINALAEIERVCALRFEWVDRHDFHNIAMRWSDLNDGPGGVLAQSEMSCGDNEHCKQWYDQREHWSMQIGRPELGRQSLFATVLHEVGHACGLHHGPGLMSAYANSEIWKLQPSDIEEFVLRYGPPPPDDADAVDAVEQEEPILISIGTKNFEGVVRPSQ